MGASVFAECHFYPEHTCPPLGSAESCLRKPGEPVPCKRIEGPPGHILMAVEPFQSKGADGSCRQYAKVECEAERPCDPGKATPCN